MNGHAFEKDDLQQPEANCPIVHYDVVNPRVVTRCVDELRPHPSYSGHNLCVQTFKLSELEGLGDLAFHRPLLVTRDRFIISGYEQWELAKQRSRPTLQCMEYDLTPEQALQFLIQTHRRSAGLNDFLRIELALDLEPSFNMHARLNQQAGGQHKGLSKLTVAEQVDSRREVARVAGVSTGNVHKVKRILANACSSVLEAARAREISINKAEKWSLQPHVKQQELLRHLRISHSLKKRARQIVAKELSKLAPSKTSERALKIADLVRLANHLAILAESNSLGSIELKIVNTPGSAVFVTQDLIQCEAFIQALTTQEEVPVT
jgi:hypothetical protein